MLGVDTTRPTVFYVNWYGRPDFRFHTYRFAHVPPGFPAPWADFNHAALTRSFGGTTPDDPQQPLPELARVWFADLSAGPTLFEFDLAPRELDAWWGHDGIADHRVPPIWEYGTSHWYRPFDDLSADLALITRYVAVYTLFAASAVYGPDLSPPLLVDDIEIDITLVDWDPLVDPPDASLHPEVIESAFDLLDPSRTFSYEIEVVPVDARIREAFSCPRGVLVGPDAESCYLPTPDTELGGFATYADLDKFADSRRSTYLEGRRYEVPVFALTTPLQWLLGAPYFGLSSSSPYETDPDREGDGPQRWNLAYLNTAFITSDMLISHEVGHHIGFLHPFQAWDGDGVPHGDVGETYFMGIGNGVNSTMSYANFTEQFSQFDRDNLDRWMTGMRLQWANRILADVVASPRAGRAATQVAEADRLAGVAAELLAAWDLRGASRAARDAYAQIVAAAAAAHVPIEPWSGRADQGEVGFEAWNENPVLHDDAPADARTASAGDAAVPPPPGPIIDDFPYPQPPREQMVHP